jgi:uncharacterized protein (DUF433 family)
MIDWKTRITTNPAVLAGKPTVRGLRISVEQVLRALVERTPEGEILAEHPDLEPEDLQACLAYALEVVATERVYPIRVGA